MIGMLNAIRGWFARKSLAALMIELVGSALFFCAAALATVLVLWLGLECSFRYLGNVGGAFAFAATVYVTFVASTSRKIGRTNPATGKQDLYLRRFYLTPRIPFFRVRFFLHHILRSDDDKAPHDHPWPFTSLILWGKYIEHVFYPRRSYFARDKEEERHATPGTVLRNAAEHTHKIEIVRPVWSLVMAGAGQREWGFWVMNEKGPDRWVQWREYLDLPMSTEPAKEDRISDRSCPGW